MARCSHSDCRRWRPDALARYTRSGLTVDGAWFCSASCVESSTQQRLLDVKRSSIPAPAIPPLRLGVLLLHQGAITSEDLKQALESQRTTQRPLGAELLHMGIDSVSILRALAAQAGVNYLANVDPACVRSAPGGLSADEVRALGVVPIQCHLPSQRLVVACLAPVPKAALSALRQLTGCTPEPLLVTDSDLAALMHSYGTSAPAPHRRVGFVNADNVGAAAAHIAAVAESERAITLTEAHSDWASWVRIESAGVVDTLFMRYDESLAMESLRMESVNVR
jgi:hypothetical protein